MAPSASIISRSTLGLLARDGEKPTSTFLKSGVPGIIIGVYVLLTSVSAPAIDANQALQGGLHRTLYLCLLALPQPEARCQRG